MNNVAEAVLYYGNEKGIAVMWAEPATKRMFPLEVTTNIALACKATELLAKPGMGCDEELE